MSDPFEALREPVTPADPDPGFAGRLRQRLTREIFASAGGTMSQPTTTQHPTTPLRQTGTPHQAGTVQRTGAVQQTGAQREHAWPPALTPYIMVSDARRAVDWYVEVFGAERRGDPHVNADGTIGHVEVGIDDGVLMLSEPSDLWPDVPVRAPENPATFSHTLHLQVGDVDGTTERARQAGAAVEREPADQPYGRGAVIVDPFGHRWMVLRPPAGATRLRQGDVANVTVKATDVMGAKDFYEAVLQVPFASPHPGQWRTVETSPPLGIQPADGGAPGARLSFRVDDIAAAVGRVRDAGGRAGEPERKAFGLIAECADDQGTEFNLWQP